MADLPSSNRLPVVDRVIAIGLALLLMSACSKDTTSPSVASAVTIVSGASQSATVGAALAAPVVIRVVDASGNPVAGAAVTFTPRATSGAVSAAQVVTDATGSAQVSWTLGTIAGTDSLAVGVGALAPTMLTAVATPDVAASIAIVAGNDQSAPALSTLATVLAVKVTDRFGNAIPNATVQWSDDADGIFGATTTATDVDGIARVQYTLGSTSGAEDVMATLMSAATPMVASFVELVQ